MYTIYSGSASLLFKKIYKCSDKHETLLVETALAGADERTRGRYFNRTAVFCGVVMVLMCCLVALLAVAGQMIGYRVETPWLSFTLTGPVFSAVVLTGTAVLALLHFWLARTAARVTFGLLH